MLAFGTEIGTVLYIASLLVTAALLLSKKKPKAAPLDDALKSVATQGAYIPLVIGRQRVGAVQIWVEDATPGFLTESISGGTPGVGKGGGGVPTQPTYIEKGLHALCVGPASELRAIYQNNEVLWSGLLTPANTPSGSRIPTVLEPGSHFRVYWGFPEDPEILYLAASETHGLSVSYPLCMKILWDDKDLGQSRQWPRLEYEVVCPCYSEVATSPSEIPRTGIDNGPLWRDYYAALPPQYTPGPGGQANFGLRWEEGNLIYDYYTDRSFRVGNYQFADFLNGFFGFFSRQAILKIWVGDNAATSRSGNTTSGNLGLQAGRWYYYYFTAVLDPTGFVVRLGTEASGDLIKAYDPATPPLGHTNPGSNGFLRTFLSVVDSSSSDGVNPVHIVDQLLFAKFPFGAARDRSKFDSLSIDVAGEIIQSELIRGGVTIADGESLDGPLSSIMQDIGLMIPLDPETGLYVFRLLRYEEGGPDLGPSILLEYPEIETVRGDRPIDTVAFTYRDRARAYREVPIKVIDGGQLQDNEAQRAQKVPITVTCDRDSVSRIAPRRGQEALGNLSSLKFLANHQTFAAVPGSRFRCSLIDPGTLFILTDIKRSTESSKVELGALVDSYDPPPAVSGLLASLSLDNPPPVLQSNRNPAEALEDFYAIELPRGLASSARRVSMFLCGSRRSSQTAAAGFWLSRDGLAFTWHGNAPIVVRGELVGALGASDPAVDESARAFTCLLQEDAATIEDLTLNESSWRAGRQIMLIGNEVIFLRNGLVTVPGSPCEGEISGLIRGRAGTEPITHAAGTPFLVFLAHRMEEQASDVFLPGKTLHYKAVGVENRRLQALDDVTAKTLPMIGLAMRPKTPSALRLGAFEEAYDADAASIRFDWCYHSVQFPRTGLGNQSLGDASGLSEPAGHFVVSIYTGDEAPAYQTTSNVPFFEVSNALRDSLTLDNGVLWTFSVIHVEGSFSSGEATISIQSF